MSDDDIRDEDTLKGDAKILAEAKRRFKRCEDVESTARRRFLEDTKFVNGDAYNHYQWPDTIRMQRDGEERPCLTINKTRQHCLQIINDARQNKTSVKVKPIGDGADYDAAQIYEGIVRRVEYQSNAQACYDLATVHQVHGGIGYWRVVTDYAGPMTFDQDIFIRPVVDPMMIFLDPDIMEPDGSDARFGIVFKRMSKDHFRAAHPDFDLDQANSPALGNEETWTHEDQVIIAEYFRKTEKKDKLVSYLVEQTGERKQVLLSEIRPLGKMAVDLILKDPETRVRTTHVPQIEWFKIIGDEIVERRDWAGKYIPIVRVIGEETIIDGELDRKGHVRALIDAQRMYNYNSSASIEYGALQSKSPYIAPVQAIEGLETYWETANTTNHSVLPFNHRDDDGQEIPPPQRAPAPGTAPAYIEGMQAAANDMQLVSGQYEAEMGAPGNERSGKAINERQRQGDRATYHYIDHLAMAIRFTGKIILDLAPKIYDTPRVLKILQEDGTDLHIQIDPTLPNAYQQAEDEREGQIAAVFNPSMGDYEVQADVGPDYATRRQEAFDALSQIAVSNQELMHVIGDLVLKAADFPMAEEAAERLRRLVPPQALGEGPSPQETQLNGQLQAAMGVIQKLTQELTEAKSKALVSEEKRGTAMYDAVTRRLDALLKHLKLPESDQSSLEEQLVLESHRSSLAQEEAANNTALSMLDREHQIAVTPQPTQPQGQNA